MIGGGKFQTAGSRVTEASGVYWDLSTSDIEGALVDQVAIVGQGQTRCVCPVVIMCSLGVQMTLLYYQSFTLGS
jgi:hypothetical protein